MEGPTITIGSIFPDKIELKVACHALATHENFEFTVIKSDRHRFTIRCIGEGCPWRLHARAITDAKDGSFEIKTLNNEHNCLGVQRLGHQQVSAPFVARHIQAKVRDNPNYRPIEIQQDIRRELGITIPYKQAS